jgi:uncharacterized protein (DUF1684 family)
MFGEIRSRALRTIGLVATLLAPACGVEPSGTMVHLRPPDRWSEWLAEARQTKNAFFRSAADSPVDVSLRDRFEGLDYWEPNAAYYFAGDIRLYEQPERFRIITTSGEERPCERLGWVEFLLDAQPQRLQVYRLLDVDVEASLFLPFADGTTGRETYGAGRYVDLEGPPGGPYVLDFNRAYNPSCAYGSPERFACPVTPPENRLSIRIEAGERGYLTRADGGA